MRRDVQSGLVLPDFIVPVIAEHQQVISRSPRRRELRDKRIHLGKGLRIARRRDSNFVRAPIGGFVVAEDDVVCAAPVRIERDCRPQPIQPIHIERLVRRQPFLEYGPELRERLITNQECALANPDRVEKSRLGGNRAEMKIPDEIHQLCFRGARKRRANSRYRKSFEHGFDLSRCAFVTQTRDRRHDRRVLRRLVTPTVHEQNQHMTLARRVDFLEAEIRFPRPNIDSIDDQERRNRTAEQRNPQQKRADHSRPVSDVAEEKRLRGRGESSASRARSVGSEERKRQRSRAHEWWACNSAYDSGAVERTSGRRFHATDGKS